MIADGTWLYSVPAQTVRDHIAELRKAGMSLRGIARTGNLAYNTVASIAHDYRQSIQGPTAAAILAIRPQPSIPIGFVVVVGSMRRVRALVAFGYSLTEIARRLDKHVQAMWEIAWERQTYVTVETHQTIAALYERLSTAPGPSSRARNTGRRNDWAPPLAWDEIDDPNAVPHSATEEASFVVDPVVLDRALAGQRPPMTPLERHHAIHLGVSRGIPLSLIATRLHISHTNARKWADRPLPAGYEMAA